MLFITYLTYFSLSGAIRVPIKK